MRAEESETFMSSASPSALLIATCLLCGNVVRAQPANPHDATIDTVRVLTTIGASDQGRIETWVEAELKAFRDFGSFRRRFRDQFNNSRNTPAFVQELAKQTGKVAAQTLGGPAAPQALARALARALVDIDRVETVVGLTAGLASSDSLVRHLCASGLTAQKRAIVSDQAMLTQTVAALGAAGLKETDPVALGRIYDALAYGTQVATVLDAYLAIFDQRLGVRRGQGVIADGAELYAFEPFALNNVTAALNAQQKSDLVARLAVFLRLDAERYQTANLNFSEIDRLERLLSLGEEVLSAVVGGAGGNVRGALDSGGRANRRAVLAEAYRWVGDPKSGQAGTINAAPWNVKIGAP